MTTQTRRDGLRPWPLAAILVLAAATSTQAQQQAAEARTHAVAAPAGEVRQAQAVGVNPVSQRREIGWVYNTHDCPDCFGGVNIAWNDPDCYLPGGDCAGEIYILPLNRTPVPYGDEILQAPIYDDGLGGSWITDIFFDDYEADLSAWDDVGELEPLLAFSTYAWTSNAYGSGVDKTFVLNCCWFSEDGSTFHGGWVWNLSALDGESLMYEVIAGTPDEPLDPADTFEIGDRGILCLDYMNETLEGHDDGGAFAFFLGGDLADASFPYPSDLYEVGYNEELYWLSSGIDDPNLDPDWDGEPGLSYLDILNTGHLVNWDFASDAGQLGHGYPAKMGIETAGPICGDIDGDGRVETSDLGICLAAFGLNDNGDVDGDGDSDQQDIAWILTYLSCGYGDNPPCGPCEPIGQGTIELDLAQVDNTSVKPGDDSLAPGFDGGVTHFTFDLFIAVTADNDWTTQRSFVELQHPEVAFFNHGIGTDLEPNPALFGLYPALEFDSFYANPPELFDARSPHFAVPPSWNDSTVAAIWFDPSYSEVCVATTQRFTVVVPADSGIVPAVLPDDCAHDFALLAHISTDVTAASTGADLLHDEFAIVDLAQPICPGDADGDDDVDQADLGVLLSTYNRPADDPDFDPRADFDCDGDVDQSDLGTLLGNYGADC
jgi:hypothetical protein